MQRIYNARAIPDGCWPWYWLSSRLVGQLNKVATVQIALRLPEPDVAKARELATRKGIGYQTLLKMLVHEGLRREARRA